LNRKPGLFSCSDKTTSTRGSILAPLTLLFSSIKNYDDDTRGVRRRRYLRDDLRDFKIWALQFDGNLNSVVGPTMLEVMSWIPGVMKSQSILH